MIPVKYWCEPDEKTMAQVSNLARLPFAHSHIALMPDAHMGYGMPIGGVLATKGAIIPNAVGVDIGCGVLAVKTDIRVEDFLPHRDAVMHQIQRDIPVGFNRHKIGRSIPDGLPAQFEQYREVAETSMGTLGGGNHFIEAQSDPEGFVWFMIHSGSRNLGKQVCDYYNNLAKQTSDVDPAWDLAHLNYGTREFDDYLEAMYYCLDYAFENRQKMMDAVMKSCGVSLGSFREEAAIDVHHNYAEFDTNLGAWIHRKGAVKAVGTVVIPGSMGTASYVGEGLANPESFSSCSHGAGRAMGRNAAKKAMTAESVFAELDEKNVALYKHKKSDVAEEAPGAYKDIEDVMAKQSDLVHPDVRLTPVAVIKG